MPTETIKTVRIAKTDIKRRKLKRAIEHVFGILSDQTKPHPTARAEAHKYLLDFLGRRGPDSRKARTLNRTGGIVNFTANGGKTQLSVPTNIMNKVLEWLKKGRKIEAIRELRTYDPNRIGLKEAKDIVEQDVRFVTALSSARTEMGWT